MSIQYIRAQRQTEYRSNLLTAFPFDGLSASFVMQQICHSSRHRCFARVFPSTRSPVRSTSTHDDARAVVCRAVQTGLSASTIAYRQITKRQILQQNDYIYVRTAAWAKRLSMLHFRRRQAGPQAAPVRPTVGGLSSTRARKRRTTAAADR